MLDGALTSQEASWQKDISEVTTLKIYFLNVMLKICKVTFNFKTELKLITWPEWGCLDEAA